MTRDSQNAGERRSSQQKIHCERERGDKNGQQTEISRVIQRVSYHEELCCWKGQQTNGLHPCLQRSWRNKLKYPGCSAMFDTPGNVLRKLIVQVLTFCSLNKLFLNLEITCCNWLLQVKCFDSTECFTSGSKRTGRQTWNDGNDKTECDVPSKVLWKREGACTSSLKSLGLELLLQSIDHDYDS